MKKSKIYTRTGDKGDTSLVSGNRISKSDLRIDLYGELDELNSRIGFSCSLLSEKKEFSDIVEFLHFIQSAIFDLGSNIACEYDCRAQYNLPQLSDEVISKIENEIDRLDQLLPAITHFILPGGSTTSSTVHLCRTNARKVERLIVQYTLSSQEELPLNSVIFLNRLSDYFFVLARYINQESKSKEIQWKPR